eukprot:755109-Hanusia_phi.AAC.1
MQTQKHIYTMMAVSFCSHTYHTNMAMDMTRPTVLVGIIHGSTQLLEMSRENAVSCTIPVTHRLVLRLHWSTPSRMPKSVE